MTRIDLATEAAGLGVEEVEEQARARADLQGHGRL